MSEARDAVGGEGWSRLSKPTSTREAFASYFRAEQILKWPNLFTFIRACCIPLFLWLLFVKQDRALAAILLGALGATDWVDGWIARTFDQQSDFGAAFDPFVDRVLFVVSVPSLMIDGSVPLLVALAALLREVVLGLSVPVAAALGADRLRVTKEGKIGTFLLMVAFPLFLGSVSRIPFSEAMGWLAWICAIPGLLYSWYAALFQYLPRLWKAESQADS